MRMEESALRAYKQNLAGQLDSWRDKISRIENKKQKVAHRNRNEFERQMTLMEVKLEALRDHLSDLQRNGGIDGEREAIIRKLLHELNDAFDSAMGMLI